MLPVLWSEYRCHRQTSAAHRNQVVSRSRTATVATIAAELLERPVAQLVGRRAFLSSLGDLIVQRLRVRLLRRKDDGGVGDAFFGLFARDMRHRPGGTLKPIAFHAGLGLGFAKGPLIHRLGF